MRTKEQVVAWMREKNWYPRYCANFDACRTGCRSVEEFIASKDGRELLGLIDYAFCWMDTPEGEDFWYDIDNDLRDYIM